MLLLTLQVYPLTKDVGQKNHQKQIYDSRMTATDELLRIIQCAS